MNEILTTNKLKRSTRNGSNIKKKYICIFNMPIGYNFHYIIVLYGLNLQK